jgi:hypothetical protein
MFSTIAIAITLVGAAVAQLVGFQTIDWSGTWTSRPDRDVEVLRNVHGTPRGWDGFVEELTRSGPYTIAVAQADNDVTITFPGGANNMLTLPGAAIVEEPRTTVVNRSDWWTKRVTAARWNGASLELTCASSSGWWKNAVPETATLRPTDFRIKLTFTPTGDPNELSLRLLLADEMGELEYRQLFRRQPRGR